MVGIRERDACACVEDCIIHGVGVVCFFFGASVNSLQLYFTLGIMTHYMESDFCRLKKCSMGGHIKGKKNWQNYIQLYD